MTKDCISLSLDHLGNSGSFIIMAINWFFFGVFFFFVYKAFLSLSRERPIVLSGSIQDTRTCLKESKEVCPNIHIESTQGTDIGCHAVMKTLTVCNHSFLLSKNKKTSLLSNSDTRIKDIKKL